MARVKTFICPNFLECQDKMCHWNTPNSPTLSRLSKEYPLRICCYKESGFWIYIGKLFGNYVEKDPADGSRITLVEVKIRKKAHVNKPTVSSLESSGS